MRRQTCIVTAGQESKTASYCGRAILRKFVGGRSGPAVNNAGIGRSTQDSRQVIDGLTNIRLGVSLNRSINDANKAFWEEGQTPSNADISLLAKMMT